MKKLLFAAAAVFAFGFANAQESSNGFSKGAMFVSGSLSIGSEKTGDFKESVFIVSPKMGYFVSENIAIGARLGYGTSKAESANVDVSDNTYFSVGAFGRYYFTPASQFSLFTELGFDTMSFENKLTNAKSKGVNAGLGLGMNYFVSNSFAIEAGWAGLTYATDDNGGNGADKTNSFALDFDLSSINFGVLYKF